MNQNSYDASWRRPAREAAKAARLSGAKALTEIAAKTVLSSYGIRTPHGVRLARREDATDAALSGLKPPFVAKILTRDGAHKSDFGGVRLNLSSATEVAAALAAIGDAAAKVGVEADGFLVEEQAAQGVELVLGGVVDPRFGPCVMVGLGGVFVEIFEDVAFRACPIDEAEARAMLAELKAAPILSGARGSDGVDMGALVAALVAFGGPNGVMMALDGEVAEIDINPLIAGPAGVVAVDARILLSADATAPTEPAPPLDRSTTRAVFRPLFQPESIAILGASSSGGGFGNEVISHSLAFGYKGRITPIHPKATEIQGLKAAPSLAALDEPVDFAYVAIGADATLEALGAAPGKARFVQVMSSGFAESEEGVEKERRLLETAQAGGFRLIGPNCLGVHSPRGGLTFVGGADPTPGGVGVISQSGGLAVDVILRGGARGLKFSAVTTLGNSADLTPADLLEHHFADPETEVIGLYLEDVRDGRRFLQRLKEYGGEKPVVMLVGGRTEAGGRAAASHTGALAADARLWSGIERQTGAVVVDTLDEFLNALLIMQSRGGERRPTRRIALFGNGGGSSVLAADAFAREGLETPRFSAPTLARLEALGLPPGTGLANPVDTPAGTLRHRDGAVAGEILDILVGETALDAIVLHVNLPVFTTSVNQRVDVIGGLVREATRIGAGGADGPRIALVLRSDGAEETDARRRKDRRTAIDAGIPVFDELPEAAKALGALARWEAAAKK